MKNESLTSRDEQIIQEGAVRRLNELGLEIDDLRDKNVLDLGSGKSFVGEFLNSEGIDCVSLDCNGEDLQTYGTDKRVIAWGDGIPVESNSRDIVISTLGIPMLAGLTGRMVQGAKEKDWEYFYYELREQITEIKRVLKPGGEFRIFPIDIQFLANQAFFNTMEKSREEQEAAIDNMRLEAFSIYKELGFYNAEWRENQNGSEYLRWVKPEESDQESSSK